MVNNSTNTNKKNNHLSPQLTQHKNKTMTYDVENPAPGLGQAYKCGRVNRIMSISTNVQKLEKNGLNSN